MTIETVGLIALAALLVGVVAGLLFERRGLRRYGGRVEREAVCAL